MPAQGLELKGFMAWGSGFRVGGSGTPPLISDVLSDFRFAGFG